jgi:hypothetical protein
MNLVTNKKAVSTFILIILILCFAVFGAFISYMWVMGIYYKMPENTSLLMVTDAQFSVYNARYFNATILNPSNSILDVNITAIRLSIEESNETYKITDIEAYGTTGPESIQFPYLIRKGTEQKFKCDKNWGGFAGKNVRIEPVTSNSSTKSFSYKTPTVELTAQTPDPEEWTSVESFNLTVKNAQESEINLTVSDIMVSESSISEKVTPKLSQNLSRGQEIVFQCDYNWESFRGQNVTLTVKTSEGYEATNTTNKLLGAALYIDKVEFDYTDTTYFNLTISSEADSTTTATISGINLTLQGREPFAINRTREGPFKDLWPIFRLIPQNGSRTFECSWNWSQYRNESLTINVYTEEGFTVPTKSMITPFTAVWNITDLKFDFDDLEQFFVNVTNMPCSLHEINVTKILLDTNQTNISPPITVQPNETISISCMLPWKEWINKSISITAFTENGLNVSRTLKIPSVGLKLLGSDKLIYGDLLDQNTTISIPYVNITISNSINSLQNVTITKIIFEALNKTYEIDTSLTYPQIAPSGYNLTIGENVTIVCPWNRFLYAPLPATQIIIVTVYTAEGFQTSKIYYASPP